ncbi:MAG: hypothetical protein ACYDHA_12875 [Bellilinea sp.]
MLTNLDVYKKDLDSLIMKGESLLQALKYECFPDEYEKEMKLKLGDKAKEFLHILPSFTKNYQSWYSEAIYLIKQLMPERLADFVRYYEKPKSRKDIDYENYKIEDCLQGLNITFGLDNRKIVGRDAAIPLFRQQLAIVKSIKTRFESSLFDIRQLVQADLFDSELDAASELAKHKFLRAAGAVAGVVLENHLAQVCDYHGVKISKKEPTISELNDLLKKENVIDVPTWRNIQYLADIRNLCDHNKEVEPTPEKVDDLIVGVMKVTKTLF